MHVLLFCTGDTTFRSKTLPLPDAWHTAITEQIEHSHCVMFGLERSELFENIPDWKHLGPKS